MAGNKVITGGTIIFDEDDRSIVGSHNWYVNKGGYAIHRTRKGTIRLHRLINNTPDGLDTDHINGNKLDNRRSNLRTVTRSQNMFNVDRTNVCWDKERNRWITHLGRKFIGRYDTKEEAIKAYYTALKGVF